MALVTFSGIGPWQNSRAGRLMIGVGCVALVILIQFERYPRGDNELLFSWFYPAVFAATALGRLEGGIAACALTVAFVLGFHAFAQRALPLDGIDLVKAVVFVLGSMVVIAITATLGSAAEWRRRNRSVHEAEAQVESARHNLVLAELHHRSRLAAAFAHVGTLTGPTATLPVRLLDLLEQALASHRARIDVSGCDLMLNPQAGRQFRMLVNELLAQSTWIGALSVPAGRVSISGSSAVHDGRRMYTFRWAEHGGDPVGLAVRSSLGPFAFGMGQDLTAASFAAAIVGDGKAYTYVDTQTRIEAQGLG
ncbi:MAG: hypothetical protein U1E23_01485 [Reyranellaceae bacterium]